MNAFEKLLRQIERNTAALAAGRPLPRRKRRKKVPSRVVAQRVDRAEPAPVLVLVKAPAAPHEAAASTGMFFPEMAALIRAGIEAPPPRWANAPPGVPLHDWLEQQAE